MPSGDFLCWFLAKQKECALRFSEPVLSDFEAVYYYILPSPHSLAFRADSKFGKGEVESSILSRSTRKTI